MSHATITAAQACRGGEEEGSYVYWGLIREGTSHPLFEEFSQHAGELKVRYFLISQMRKTSLRKWRGKEDFLSEHSPCPIWLGAVLQMNRNAHMRNTYVLQTLKRTMPERKKWKSQNDHHEQCHLSETAPRLLHLPDTPPSKRRNGCLPVTRMVHSCVDSMRVMTAEAETMALLVALICSNTKFKKVNQK